MTPDALLRVDWTMVSPDTLVWSPAYRHQRPMDSLRGFACDDARPVLVTLVNGEKMITLNVNGKHRDVDVPNDMPLLWTLRDVLGMTGTKFGCGAGLCGACTIHIDGQPARACITPVSAAMRKRITTIEGISTTSVGKKVQAAWLALDVPQCGYCQSGQIMSASALLATTVKPSDRDIDTAMAGNICRCGTYPRIRAAIKQAAK